MQQELVGRRAPACRLPGPGGSVVDLAEYAGKWVVLYFYPKDSTSGCTTEALEFSALVDEFAALGAVVVGVSKDSVASHEKFSAKNDLRVTLLSDADTSVLTSYGAFGTKKMYGKEVQGTIRSTVIIDPQGVVAEVFSKVKAAGHAAAVLARLRELAAARG